MSRTRYRFRTYDVRADQEPDAEPITYGLRCSVCDAEGPVRECADEALAWIFEHVKSEPEHLTYRETIGRSYRAIPGDWR